MFIWALTVGEHTLLGLIYYGHPQRMCGYVHHECHKRLIFLSISCCCISHELLCAALLSNVRQLVVTASCLKVGSVPPTTECGHFHLYRAAI